MTQLRKLHKCPKCGWTGDDISNHFDEIERGTRPGNRATGFTDIDAVTHDGDTDRFLLREFKHGHERLDDAQRWTYEAFARVPRCTAWLVRLFEGGQIEFSEFGSAQPAVAITEEEYRARVACWWRGGLTMGKLRMAKATLRPRRTPSSDDIAYWFAASEDGDARAELIAACKLMTRAELRAFWIGSMRMAAAAEHVLGEKYPAEFAQLTADVEAQRIVL